MLKFFQKIPFVLELFINGTFMFLYSIKNFKELSHFWGTYVSDNFIEKHIEMILQIGVWVVPVVILVVVITHYIGCKSFEEFLRRYLFSIIVLIPLLITRGDMEFTFWLAAAHLLSSILSLFDTESSSKDQKVDMEQAFFKRIQLRPAQTVILSFVTIIIFGTILLLLPNASKGGNSISLVDSIFTATSAVCVTGLTTLSLQDNFSLFGQLIVLVLIQIGGLGIMTLSSSMTILLGRSMAMKDRLVMQDLLDISSMEDLMGLIFDIIRYTFFIELWGGIILTFAFTFEGFEFGKALYYGFFHSISAFCNAGFSLFNTSLESYATNPLIHGTVAILITLGGLGFIVLRELKEIIVKRKSFVRVGMHTKIVLVTSFVLTCSGAMFIFFGEFLNSLDSYNLWEKIQVAFFQSITLRTAGFNTLPLSSMHTYTLYIMALFMFIGASPGSTGGGIKTTTFAILINSIKSTLKGHKKVEIFDRSISPPMVVRATALTFISILITCFFILVLMKFEPNQPFLSIFFEVISAGGTVGLTLGGVTPYLSVMGKMAISFLMLIGRTGPLTLVLALGEKDQKDGKIEYPDGRLMIG